jgi:hypothetical protein
MSEVTNNGGHTIGRPRCHNPGRYWPVGGDNDLGTYGPTFPKPNIERTESEGGTFTDHKNRLLREVSRVGEDHCN